jgi:methionyl-tRNA formyltransferase
MQNKLRIVFMGTPEFAVESLKALINSEHEVVGVVTAPDKPAGRGNKIVSSDVKVFAQEKGIKNILQPANLKSPDFLDELKNLNADLQVVVAFRMLPEVVWAMPPKGTINLHASLLPDYRGAAPINWAIINGEEKTGVTTFFIEKEIDTGKILFSDEVTVTEDMNAGELHDMLMVKGAQLLLKTVNSIADGDYEAVDQNGVDLKKVLHAAPKIFKEDCKIDWNKKGNDIHNLIRGLSPYPTAWTEFKKNDETIAMKIFRSKFIPESHHNKPGEIITDGKSFLKISVIDGFIEILNIQQPGKRQLDIVEFLRGFQEIKSYTLLI